MGTTYSIGVVNPPTAVTQASLQAEVEDILGRIDSQFSIYRDDSEMSRFNQMESTDWWPVSSGVARVVEAARTMSELSGGAFDITAGPLLLVWGYGPRPGQARIPGPDEIEVARASVGYQKLRIRGDPPALRKQVKTLQVNPNALVAGHAADLIASRFESLGLRNYLVDLGGEFRLKGRNQKGKAWAIAIEMPLPDQQQTGPILELTDCAVSTSGNYRDYFEINGVRYSHVLDPRTGTPIRHELASVTVVGSSAMQADAWATTLLVLGETEGYQLAARKNVAALFMLHRGQGFAEKATPAFAAVARR